MMNCCTSRTKEGSHSRELQSANQLSKAMQIEKYIFQHFHDDTDESLDESISVVTRPKNMIRDPTLSKSDWLRLVHTKTVQEVAQHVVLHNIHKGVPTELRPAIWIWMSGAEQLRMQHGNDLYSKLRSTPSLQDANIFKEVKIALKGMREELFDLLRAYSNYDNEVRITQELITIVLLLFEVFDPSRYSDVKLSFARNQYEIPPDIREVTTFWVLIYVMHVLMMREGTCSVSSPVFINKFSRKSQMEAIEHVPKVMNHLKSLGLTLPEAFKYPILVLLKQHCPEALFMTIFDAFLWQGEGTYTYDVVCPNTVLLNLVKQSEDVIVLFQTKQDAMTYLNESLIPYGLEKLQRKEAIFKRLS